MQSLYEFDTAEDLTSGILSGDPSIDALVYERDGMPNWNWLVAVSDNPRPIYFTFDLQGQDDLAYRAGDAKVSWTAFNATQQQHTRTALDYIDQLTGLEHTEAQTTDSIDLIFAYTDFFDPNYSGVAYGEYTYLTDSITASVSDLELTQSVYLDTSPRHQNQDLTPGDLGYETLLHELGHVLGLVHPHEGEELDESLDNTSHTLMSYQASGGPYSTYQSLDLAALEWLYGADGMGGAGYGVYTNAAQPISRIADSNDTLTLNELPSGQYTLAIIFDHPNGPVLLQNLIETVSETGHQIDYQGISYAVSDIKDLIFPVLRDDEFTDAFAAEISESYPEYSGITYADAVLLIGSSEIDTTILTVAGADGAVIG